MITKTKVAAPGISPHTKFHRNSSSQRKMGLGSTRPVFSGNLKMEPDEAGSAGAAGIPAERSCSELRNQQGAAEQAKIFHEHSHMDLRHQRIVHRPEVVHHYGNRNQEEYKEPGAQFCAIAQQDAQAASKGQRT